MLKGSDDTDTQKNRAEINIPILPTESASRPQLAFFYYFSNYLRQSLKLSTQLIQNLLCNSRLIDLRTSPSPPKRDAEKISSLDTENRSLDSDKSTSRYQVPPRQISTSRRIECMEVPPKQKNKKKKGKASNEEESYNPDGEDSNDIAEILASETKNIPKNYGKAIVNFILRNEDYVRSVLEQLKIDYSDFMEGLQRLRKNLDTIVELRSLWLQEKNPHAKAYRIITSCYLRKHCLSYIFNSRVQNFHKNIKYRYKMIESVSDPKNFKHMKDF